MQTFFEYSEEVKEALNQGKPILALESTVITHGLPRPDNLSTGLALEKIARENNVVPATIAVLKGKIKIGLSTDELKCLAFDNHVIKASVRDLGFVVSQKLSAGMTVAATLACAAHAKIKVFSTGGIGGVHRGEELDVSADLTELAKSSVAVVCAGAKAILDLPRTLEFLETHSVPVYGYRTDTLPAFYSPTSSLELPIRIDDIQSLSSILRTQWKLGLVKGALIANPIPADAAISTEVIEPIIHSAIEKANLLGVSGKALTPFLLSEVAKMTEGKSIAANIALLKNNVTIGAQLACGLLE